MPSRLTLLAVWIALLALLGLSMAASSLHWGTPALNLLAAALTAALIAWFDMHLVSGAGILRLLAVGLLLWLMIMFGLGLADWLTRVAPS